MPFRYPLNLNLLLHLMNNPCGLLQINRVKMMKNRIPLRLSRISLKIIELNRRKSPHPLRQQNRISNNFVRYERMIMVRHSFPFNPPRQFEMR